MSSSQEQSTQREQLARSLEVLEAVQQDGVVRANTLSRTHRERLVRSGFLQEVIKGWLIVAHPALQDGSSTGWYASFWAFVRQYLASRFGNAYCLSAEASLKRHARNPLIPTQVTVITQTGSNQVVPLPFGTSLLLYKDVANFPAERTMQEVLWLMDLSTALVRAAPAFFQASPEDAQIALRMLRDPAPLLRVLLATGNASAAGRLAGALRAMGNVVVAERIVAAMRAAGFALRVSDPFVRASATKTINAKTINAKTVTGTMPSDLFLPQEEWGRTVSPSATRLRLLWATFRPEVARLIETPSLNTETPQIETPPLIPAAPGLPQGPAAYLAQVEERYGSDAYNSLSIEGYRVTPELIERVRQGAWNPEAGGGDRQQQDALAARGYFQAFQSVKGSLGRILSGAGGATVVAADHPAWYQSLFAPAVQAGLLPASSLAGYRNQSVYLRGSRHVPPSSDAVLDSLDALFALLEAEPEPAVRAILGHFFFVYVHPYTDGNGRLGRFLMNCLLSEGGYPWTVIRQSRRTEYLDTLEQASVGGDIVPFARFVCEEMYAPQ